MHDDLMSAYGPQHWWPAKTPFEVILGAYLTQNTAWKAVERSLANLRAAGALTLEGLRAIPLARLRRLIRPSGFITRKAPALKAFVAMLDKEFGGSLEALAATPTSALRNACWLCPAWVLRRPTPSCFTRSAIPFQWPMSICGASPSATGFSNRQAERRISYDSLDRTHAARICRRSGGRAGATLQRVPRTDRSGWEGSLRPHCTLRGLPAGRGSEKQLLASSSWLPAFLAP